MGWNLICLDPVVLSKSDLDLRAMFRVLLDRA